MTADEIAELIRNIVQEEISRNLESHLDPILSTICVQQKDAAELAGVSPRTLATRIADGDLPVLAQDGSRKNYLTLKSLADLKQRTKSRRS